MSYDITSIAGARRFALYRFAMEAPWLKAELDKPGRSQSALARFLGLDQSSVNRMCKGTRQIKALEAEKIHAYLAATAQAGDGKLNHETRQVPASRLKVVGVVEAGSWREVAFAEDFDPPTLEAPAPIVESGAFALRVAGPSMDKLYRDGTYIVVEPWHGGPLPVGRRVVVEREKPDGTVETTVKELVMGSDGELELWPRSNHPAHQTPVPYKDVDGVTVRLIGRVTHAIVPEA